MTKKVMGRRRRTTVLGECCHIMLTAVSIEQCVLGTFCAPCWEPKGTEIQKGDKVESGDRCRKGILPSYRPRVC